jgi:hypothetical protein
MTFQWDGTDFGVSDEDLEKMKNERSFIPGLSEVQQARKILDEASPMAAAELVRLARHAQSETVRLRASVEILNRVGVNEGAGRNDAGQEPWTDLFAKVVQQVHDSAEAYANGESQGK